MRNYKFAQLSPSNSNAKINFERENRLESDYN